MRVTIKGQVTIPQGIREKFRFLPNSDVEFIEEEDRVYLRKADGHGQLSRDPTRRFVERMRGTATVRMSTEEILALTRGRE